MIDQTRLYRTWYWVHGFLWHILSGFETVMDDIHTFALIQRYRSGMRNLGTFSGWLFEQVEYASHRSDLPQEAIAEPHTTITYAVNRFILHWEETVHATATTITETFGLDEETALYAVTCSSVLWIVREAEQRAYTTTIIPELSEHHHHGYAQTRIFMQWLQDELRTIESHPTRTVEESSQLRNHINEAGQQMADTWRQAVDDMVARTTLDM